MKDAAGAVSANSATVAVRSPRDHPPVAVDDSEVSTVGTPH